MELLIFLSVISLIAIVIGWMFDEEG